MLRGIFYTELFTIFLLLLVFSTTNINAQHTINIMADEQTPIPGGFSVFDYFEDPRALDAPNDMAFIAGKYSAAGIYTNSGGSVVLVADELTPIPGGSGYFSGFGAAVSLGGDDLVFKATGKQFQGGVYKYVDGTLSVIVDKNTIAPGDDGPFILFQGVVISLGGDDIAFEAEDSSDQKGIYSYIGDNLGLVANTASIIPGGSGTFSSFRDPISIGGGDLAFKALGPGQEGIYATSGGKLILVADRSTPIPDGSGTFSSFSNPVALGEGRIAFIGTGSGQQGIYTFIDGTLTTLADNSTMVPDGSGNFLSYRHLVSLGGGNVAFAGFGSGQGGIYTYIDGNFSVVIDLTTSIPGGSGNFVNFDKSISLGGGDLAFRGFGFTGKGLYASIGGKLTLVVDLSTEIPDGIGTFFSFRPLVPIAGGDLAFVGSGISGQSGLYIYSGGELSAVADENDMVPGGSSNFTQFFFPTSNDEGDVIFGAFNKQQEGIYTYIDGILSVAVDTNYTVPGNSIKFKEFSNPVSLGEGAIAFRGIDTVGPDLPEPIYVSLGGKLSVFLDSNTPIPGTSTTFSGYGGVISLGGGNSAFRGFGPGHSGIYASIDGALSVLVDETTPIPNGSGTFSQIETLLHSGGDGSVIFASKASGEFGIYAYIDGVISLLVDTDTAIPNGSGTFAEIEYPVVIGEGDVAFLGIDSSGNRGIYRVIDGVLSVVADLTTAVPGTTVQYSHLSVPIISLGGGDVTFRGSAPHESGIYKTIGNSLAVVVDNHAQMPDDSGPLHADHDSYVSIGGGDVAFIGFNPGGRKGIYISSNGIYSAVVENTVNMPGSIEVYDDFESLASFGAGDIAFRADGFRESGVYSATKESGSLTIVSQSNPGGATGFEYTGAGFPGSCSLDGIFTLDDGEFNHCFLDANSYTVEETNSQGFTISDIDCVGASSFSTTADSVTVNLVTDETVVCTFTNTATKNQQFSLDVSVSGSGMGTVTSSPGIIDCGSQCSDAFDIGTMVELTATPDADSEFSNWGGACAGNDPVAMVTMDAAKNCEATFTLKQFDVNIVLSGPGTGSVSYIFGGPICEPNCSQSFDIHTLVTLTATPDPGSIFSEWLGPDDCLDGIIQDLTSDITCIAVFGNVAANIPEADVSIAQSVSPITAEIGQEVTYTLVVQNNGPNDATGVFTSNTLHSSLNFVSASAGCSSMGQTIICDLGDMPNGGGSSVSITAVPTDSGVITNTASVISDAQDPDSDNNISSASIQIVGAPTQEPETLIVEADVVEMTSSPGSNISIPIEIKNPDTNTTSADIITKQTVSGATFTVSIPEGFDLVQLHSTKGICEIDLGQCEIGDILPGETVTIVVDAISSENEGVFNVNFTVTTSDGELISGNAVVMVEDETVNVETTGDASGGCAIAGPNSSNSSMFSLFLYVLLPAFIFFRRRFNRNKKSGQLNLAKMYQHTVQPDRILQGPCP